MLFKDQAIHKCDQTKHRLQLCASTYALFAMQGCVFPEQRRKWFRFSQTPCKSYRLQVITVFYYSKYVLKKEMSDPHSFHLRHESW